MSLTSDQLQQLLDIEAQVGNTRYSIHQLIKSLRGTEPPVCWGQDDCSSSILSVCPWRVDCGDAPEKTVDFISALSDNKQSE